MPSAREFGIKVHYEYFSRNSKQGMSDEQKQQLYRESTLVANKASQIYLKLTGTKDITEEQKAERVRNLVKLAGYITGHKDFQVYATYKKEQKGKNGGLLLGAFHPYDGIVITEIGLNCSLQQQLLTATHEFIHAVDCEKHFSQLKKKDSLEKYDILLKEWNDRNTGLAMTGMELRTEARAIVAVQAVLGPIEDEKWREIKLFQANMLKIGLEMEYNGNGYYKDKLQQSRMVLGLHEDKRSDNFQEIINGKIVFGGIIFGNKTSINSPICKDLSFIKEGDQWKISVSVETKSGVQTAVYENFNPEDLWAAYHIVRPTAQMKKEYGLWNQECSLMHMEGGAAGRVAAHPALLTTPIGLRLITLEAISGDLAFRKEKKETGVDKLSDLGLQWFDAPSKILIEDGKLKVVADDNPDLPLLRFRLLQRTPSRRFANPSYLKSYYKHLWENDFLKLSALGLFGNFTDVVVHDTEFLENKISDRKFFAEVEEGTQAILFVDNFTRLLALLNWAADHLGRNFPSWPTEMQILKTMVELNLTPGSLQDLYRFPLKPPIPIETNGSPIKNFKSHWFHIIQNGRQIGFAQNATGIFTINGKQKSIKMQKQNIYFRDSLESGVSEQYYTRVFDDNGRMLSFNNLDFDLETGTNEKETGEKGALFDFGRLFPVKNWVQNLIYKTNNDIQHLKKGESKTVGLTKITRLDLETLTYKYSSQMEDFLVTWDENGFPSRIYHEGINTCFKAATENEVKNSFAFDVVTLEFINFGMKESNRGNLLIPIALPFNTFEGQFQIEIKWEKPLTDNDVKHLEKIGWNITKQVSPSVFVVKNNRPLLEKGLFKICKAEVNEIERWLLPDKLIDSNNDDLQKKALELLNNSKYLNMNGQLNNPFYAFFALLHQINLVDLDDVNSNLLTESVQNKCIALSQDVSNFFKINLSNIRKQRTSSEILKNPIGACAEMATLLTGLLRSQKIPAKSVRGVILDRYEGYAVRHAWVEVIIDGWWYRIDPAQGFLQEQRFYVPHAENNNFVENIKIIAHTVEHISNQNPGNKNKLNMGQEKLLRQLLLTYTIKSQDALCASDDQKHYEEYTQGLSIIRSCLAKNGLVRTLDLPEWRPGLIPAGMAILQVLDKICGAERRSMAERFGKEFAATNSLYPGCVYFVLPEQIQVLYESILPGGGKSQLEADLEIADLPDELKVMIGKIAISKTTMKKKLKSIRELLVKYFALEKLIEMNAKELESVLNENKLILK